MQDPDDYPVSRFEVLSHLTQALEDWKEAFTYEERLLLASAVRKWLLRAYDAGLSKECSVVARKYGWTEIGEA